jgi:2C-methyl-D-erythritol 2,4-cyclodiphosphate synthase
MDNRSREQKAVDKLVDEIADIRFKDGNFAYTVMNQPPKVQRRLMRIFLHLVRYWAIDAKHYNYHLKDEETLQTAEIINEAIEGEQASERILDNYEPLVVSWSNEHNQ